MLKSARTALLFERDIDGARNTINRAAEYGITGPLHDEIAMFLLTLKALDGKLEEALSDAQQHQQPLLVMAPKTLDIKGGEETLGQFNEGTLGLVTKTSGQWARIKTIYTPVWKNDRLSFEQKKSTGWVEITDLNRPKEPTPARELIKALPAGASG